MSAKGLPEKAVWLLIRRMIGNDPQYSFFISNAASGIRLKSLGCLSSLRRAIEQYFEETKSELGMDHYEVRKFKGWHHHMLTFMPTHFFLRHLKIRMGEKHHSLLCRSLEFCSTYCCQWENIVWRLWSNRLPGSRPRTIVPTCRIEKSAYEKLPIRH